MHNVEFDCRWEKIGYDNLNWYVTVHMHFYTSTQYKNANYINDIIFYHNGVNTIRFFALLFLNPCVNDSIFCYRAVMELSCGPVLDFQVLVRDETGADLRLWMSAFDRCLCNHREINIDPFGGAVSNHPL